MRHADDPSFFSELRTLVFAALITLLIWVWAEGENVRQVRVNMRVGLPQGGPSDLVYEMPGGGEPFVPVFVNFEGPTIAVAGANQLQGVALRLDSGAPGVPAGVGENQVVDLRRAIAAHPDIARLNLQVSGVEPETIVAGVTRLATQELPVRVEFAREVVLQGDPAVEPRRVRVRVPVEEAAKLADAQAVAFVSEDQILGLRGGGIESVQATLRLPRSLSAISPVRFSPETVAVALRLRESLETVKLPATVPVWLSLPPTEDTADWDVEVLDKFLPEVSVSGPAEQIARLGRAGQGPIKALVELTSDDLLKGDGAPTVLTLPVTFTGLPSGVTPTGAFTARVRVGRPAAVVGPPTPGNSTQTPVNGGDAEEEEPAAGAGN